MLAVRGPNPTLERSPALPKETLTDLLDQAQLTLIAREASSSPRNSSRAHAPSDLSFPSRQPDRDQKDVRRSSQLMIVIILWMVALLLSALASGVALSHILEIPGKRRMPTEYAVAVQKNLYIGYRLPAALIESVAGLATLVALVLVWGQGAKFWLTLGAWVAGLGALIVFFSVTDPQNRRIGAWRADDLPADWTRVRATWEASHGPCCSVSRCGRSASSGPARVVKPHAHQA